MIFIPLFFAELLVLFLLSGQLTKLLSLFLYRVTRSKTATVFLLAVIFFPGTLIHELSHALIAFILRIPVGEIEFVPKLREGSVKLGSVAIGKVDPVRMLLVGMAPFFVGTCMLLFTIFSFIHFRQYQNTWFIAAVIYCVFEIGNTMFSSKKDLEGALEVILVFIIFAIAFYILGFRLPAERIADTFINQSVIYVFQRGSLFLAAPLGIDVVVITLLRILRVR